MSTFEFNIALTTGAYPNLAGTSSSPAQIQAGDTIEVNITIASSVASQYQTSGPNPNDSLTVSLVTNTYAPEVINQGANNGSHTFSFTADTSWVGNNLQPMSFFTRNNGAVIGTQAAGTLVSGRIHWSVYAVPNQSHGYLNAAPVADSTASERPTYNVQSSNMVGTTGNRQIGYSTSASTQPTSFWNWSGGISGNTAPTRGGWDSNGDGIKDAPFYFWVRSSNYWATNQSLATPVAYTPPYLPTDLSISITNATLTSSNGTWTVNFTGGGSNENYAIANSAASTANPYYSSGTTKVDSGVGGSSIYNSNASNTPSGTTTYYIWGSRTRTSGGSGGQGWNTTGWGYTGQSFTVEMGVNETCDDPSGSWFDATSSAVDSDNTDNALRTRASFSGLSVNKYYVVVRQDSGGNWQTANEWWSGSTAVAKTFTDPLAVIDTQRTYKLFSNSSQSFTNATDELSFTRTRIDPVVTEPSSITVDIGDTSYTVTLTGTVAGLIYYIKDGEGTSPTTGGSATATGTTTTITVNHSSCLPANVDDSSTTVYVWAQSVLNWYSTLSYPTGDSIVVTRSDGSTGGTTVSQNSSDFGLIVYAQNGTDRLVDTTSRIGRIVASSSVSGVLGSDYNDTTNATFNALHPSFGYQSWVWNYREDATVWKYTPASGGADIDVNDAPTSGAATVSNGGNLITGLSAFVGIPGFSTDTTTWQVLVEVESNQDTKTNHRVIYYDAGDPGTVGSYGGFRVENFWNFRPQDSALTRHKYHYIVIRSR